MTHPEANDVKERVGGDTIRISSSTEFQPGQAIGGRYQVISLLGKGGMGLVYRVNQIFLNKEFALKTIEKHFMSEIVIRRFQQEARTAFALDHPNIIAVNDFGVLDDSTPFLVMELVKGETLGERLKRTGCMTVEEAIPVFVQVCFGLAYAHECGVVHRDIKPNNIMLLKGMPLGSEGSIKILDFGIAKFTAHEGGEMQALTRTGEIFGSPLYMSPEQCNGAGVDHRADIYSLGCVLFEALTGAPPCVGENALSTMMKHQTEPVLTLKQASLGSDFPQAIEDIVATMLAKSPDDRYKNLGIVAHDLGALRRGDSISATAKQTGVQAKAKARTISISSTTFYALMIGIAAVAGVVGYLFHYFQNGSRGDRGQHTQRPIIQKVIGEDPLGKDPKAAEDLFRKVEPVIASHRKEKYDIGDTTLTNDLVDDAKELVGKGKWEEAEPLLKRALETKEKALGPESKEIAELREYLGFCYMKQGRYVEAEQQFKRGLAIDEKALGPNDQHVAGILGYLGSCYSKQGRAMETEAAYKRAVAIDEKALGPNDPTVADVLSALGWCYKEQGKIEKAKAVYKRALAIYDKAQLGNDQRSDSRRFMRSYLEKAGSK